MSYETVLKIRAQGCLIGYSAVRCNSLSFCYVLRGFTCIFRTVIVTTLCFYERRASSEPIEQEQDARWAQPFPRQLAQTGPTHVAHNVMGFVLSFRGFCVAFLAYCCSLKECVSRFKKRFHSTKYACGLFSRVSWG